MTQAPSHPPVHAYEGENPFDLVPSPYGVMERWRANAMQTGEVSGLTALSDRVKNDAVGVLEELEERERTVIEREQACDARERAFGVALADLHRSMGRADALTSRLEKARADTEEEPLASPPGHKSEEPEPALAPDTVQPAHGNPPGDPEPPVTTDQTEFAEPELPHPPGVKQPIAAGLDDEEFEEEKHGD